MPTVAVYTLGCKVNQYETEAIIELFRKNKYEIVDFNGKADIYVINTCTVTNLADKKSRQMIRKAKKNNENSIVAVVGCYPQIAPDEVSKMSEVDLIIGTNNRTKIIDFIEELKRTNKSINTVNDIFKAKEYEEFPITTNKEKTRAFLKIQDGCNRFCSYCIIPYTRGPIRSRNLNNIMDEAQNLSYEGFKEIVLTGIHIESYGKDFKDNVSLVDVINTIDKIEGIKRIRLGSIEPTLINNNFLENIKSKKLCPHFHLSLQSGCDDTLQRMNRRYNTDQFRQAVNLLREYYTDVSITTDIMVGFPGETQDEFERSFAFAQEIQFSKIHVFKYSPRKGTKAMNFSNQIDSKTKEKRSKTFIDLSNKCQKEFFKKFINTQKNVLFEQKFKSDSSFLEGLTKNYIRVIARANDDLIGQIREVNLLELKDDYMKGIIEE